MFDKALTGRRDLGTRTIETNRKGRGKGTGNCATDERRHWKPTVATTIRRKGRQKDQSVRDEEERAVVGGRAEDLIAGAPGVWS